MSKRSEHLYLGHMLQYARGARERVSRISRDDFDRSEDLQIVLTHLLQNIGEAASRVSRESRAEHPQIEWEQIIGIRHRIVHDYFRIDLNVVWDAVTNDLPPLIAALEQIIPPEPPSA
jgi:uncharacterized protein with HEPN domain